MPSFSAIILTAPPPGGATEPNGSFVKIDGREAVLRTVELFLNRDNVKQIQLVVAADAMESAKQKFGHHLSFSGVKMVTGGPRWIDQIVAAAGAVAADATHVILHDAARPAVPYTDIAAVMEAAENHPAVAVVTALKTPLLELDPGGTPVARHSASLFVQLLTPQVFDRKTFDEIARTKAELHPSRLQLFHGSGLNQRVNGATDAGMIKTLIGMLPKKKIQSNSPFDEAQW
jgi:2-C-methyl-D-erythritol 4-phosphate cytidylyltransferase